MTVVKFPKNILLDGFGVRKISYNAVFVGWIKTVLEQTGVEWSADLEDDYAFKVPNPGFFIEVDKRRIFVDYSDFTKISLECLEDCDRYLKMHLTGSALESAPENTRHKLRSAGPVIAKTQDERLYFFKFIETLRTPVPKEVDLQASLRFYGTAAEIRKQAFFEVKSKGFSMTTNLRPFGDYVRDLQRHRATLDLVGVEEETIARRVLESLALGVPVVTNGRYSDVILPSGERGDILRGLVDLDSFDPSSLPPREHVIEDYEKHQSPRVVLENILG